MNDEQFIILNIKDKVVLSIGVDCIQYNEPNLSYKGFLSYSSYIYLRDLIKWFGICSWYVVHKYKNTR